MAKEKTDEEVLRQLAISRNIELGRSDLKGLDKDEFMMSLLRAKQLGVFLRDREMSRRIESGQIIRIATVITNDVEERKQYIELAMPQVAKTAKV